jgi:hypothetical protein
MVADVPWHIVGELTVTVGNRFTVISTLIGAPEHPLAVGVTVYLTIPGVVPVLVNVCAIVDPQSDGQLLRPFIVPFVGEV